MNKQTPTRFTAKVFCLGLLALACLFLNGCLFSEGPTYEPGQIIQDKRIEGSFDGGTNSSDASKWFVLPSKENKKQYTIVFTDGDARHELTGTLFKLGDMIFMDLFPVKETDVRHVPGGSITSSEILHSLMALKKHFVIRIEFTENGVNFSFPDLNGVVIGSRKAPELKIQPMGEIAGLIVPSPAKEAQKYLLRFGKDVSVFSGKGHLVKKK